MGRLMNDTTGADSILYRVMARLLSVGVTLSIALMALGFLLLAARHELGRATWLPLARVVPRTLAGAPAGILDLGVLVLFATPALRVVAAIGLFAAERQRRYVVISTVVLLLLALSVAVSAR